MTVHCSTCGAAIQEGQCRYVTPDEIFCPACGLLFPLGQGQLTITGLEDRLEHKQQQEVTYGN